MKLRKESGELKMWFLNGLSHLHSGIKDCETMCMVSSCWFSRIEDYEPMRSVAACLHSEIDYGEPMRTISAYRFSRIWDYETMRRFSSYLFWAKSMLEIGRVEN